MEVLAQLVRDYGDNKLAIAVGGVLIGAILTKFIPFLWAVGGSLASNAGRLLGGRFAYRNFERRYLDWVVTELRPLKLTGIVSYDDSKKPQMEQVFVSVHLGGERAAPDAKDALESTIDEVFKLCGDCPSWRELAVTLHRFLGHTDFMWLGTLEEFLLRRLDSPEFHRGLRNAGWLRRHLALCSDSYGRLRVGVRRVLHRILGRSALSPADHLEALAVSWARERWAAFEAGEAPQLVRTLREHNRLAILGPPGAGKTTLLQFIGLAFARERAGDPRLRQRRALKKRLGTTKWRVPVFIPLAGIAGKLSDTTNERRERSILDVLPMILPPDLQNDPAASGYFLSHFRDGKCVVLMDGLDEVPGDNEFDLVVRAIESLALNYNRNQFVVTSRIAGWRGGIGADFAILYVNDLSDEQVNTLIDSWYAAVERNAVVGRLEDESGAERNARERRAAQRARDLKEALRENVGIRLLATNPMLLSIIALVHRSLATLPKERSKLYAECAKILMEQWDISRGLRIDDTGLKLEQKETLMQQLAFALHAGEIGGSSGARVAGHAEVLQVILRVLPSFGKSAEEGPTLLQRLMERSGILTQRQRGMLGFAHHTFQEYFTAQYLARGELRTHRDFLLEPERLFSDWWHEVTLLYTGLLSDSSEFLRLLQKDRPDDLCQQRLRLAALCLGEAVVVRDTTLRQEIGTGLVKVKTRGEVTSVNGLLPTELVEYLTRMAKSDEWYAAAAAATARELQRDSQDEMLHNQIRAALEDRRGAVRHAACTCLSDVSTQVKSDDFLGTVMGLLTDKDVRVRHSAAKLLGVIGRGGKSESIARALIPTLSDSDENVRAASLRSLRLLEARLVAIDEAMAAFDAVSASIDPQVRCDAATAFPILQEVATRDQIESFAQLLIDNDPDVRREAWQARKMLTADHVLHAVDDSTVACVRMPQPTKSAAFEFLKKPGPVATLRQIDRLFPPFDVPGAFEMVDVMALSRHGLVDALTSQLGRKEQDVRDWAVRLLVALWDKGADIGLASRLEELLDASAVEVRVGAMRVVQSLGTPPALESTCRKLLHAAQARESRLRSAAAGALGTTRASTTHDAAVKVLLRLARDKSEEVRGNALRSLGVLGQSASAPAVVEAVIEGLSDRSTWVRVSAAEAAISLGPEGATEQLMCLTQIK